ncbi:MAG: GGDEF domain-containing protein [Eubacteriales bacterium]|nr:GGDEF domain-containing protein [Eubacteriales bacterium]
MNSYYVASILFTVCILSILMMLVRSGGLISGRAQLGFLSCTVLIMIAACSEFLGVLLNGMDGRLRWLHGAVKFMELSLAPIIPILCGMSIRPVKRKAPLIAFLSLHAAAELLSLFYGFVFYVDEANYYHHGSCYWIYSATYLVGMVFFLVQGIRFSRLYQNKNKGCLLMIMLLILAGVASRMLDSSLRIAWMSVAAANVLFYIYYSQMIQQVDVLTTLLNRRSYESNLTGMKKRAAVLYFDIDYFKQINDEYGHRYGDQCLAVTGKALKAAYGKAGLCYRIGGDEFCVMMEMGAQSIQPLNLAFEKEMASVRQVEERLPTVSIGYAVFDPKTMTINQATDAADKALYEEKRRKKVE